MYLTLNQAAKAVKKSTSTISKYIKDGKLSVSEKTEDGSFRIDPAELYRVFPEQHENTKVEQSRIGIQTPSNAREVELLEKMNTQQSNMIDDLKKQLKEERDERQKITMMLLEHQIKHEKTPATVSVEEPVEQAKKRWWQRQKIKES